MQTNTMIMWIVGVLLVAVLAYLAYMAFWKKSGTVTTITDTFTIQIDDPALTQYVQVIDTPAALATFLAKVIEKRQAILYLLPSNKGRAECQCALNSFLLFVKNAFNFTTSRAPAIQFVCGVGFTNNALGPAPANMYAANDLIAPAVGLFEQARNNGKIFQKGVNETTWTSAPADTQADVFKFFSKSFNVIDIAEPKSMNGSMSRRFANNFVF